MLGNLSPIYRSSLVNIHLLCLTRSTTLQKYGAQKVLEPVMKEIKHLEEVCTSCYNIMCIMSIIQIEWHNYYSASKCVSLSWNSVRGSRR